MKILNRLIIGVLIYFGQENKILQSFELEKIKLN